MTGILDHLYDYDSDNGVCEMSTVRPARYVAVIGSRPTFRNRAGNAAYLASFCSLLRGMNFWVEALFLDPFHMVIFTSASTRTTSRALNWSHCETSRLGSFFFSRRPRAWARSAINGTISALDIGKAKQHNQRQRPADVWNLPWPSDEAVRWAGRRLSVLQPDIVVANYLTRAAYSIVLTFVVAKRSLCTTYLR